ncbi:MAG: S8 family serine peptidase [Acidimicrobiia bacterium]
MRRFVVFGAFFALVGGLLAPAAVVAQEGDLEVSADVEPAARVQADKAPSSGLAQTDPELLGRTDASPISVLIKLDYDATASYRGGVRGFAATSPSATGRPLTGSSVAESRYNEHIAAVEGSAVAELRRRVPSAIVGRSLRVVYGGVSAVIPANMVAEVLAIPGVVAVQLDRLLQPLTDSSPEFVNAPYDQLGTTANAGQGTILGNLDTGIWPEHPSFADLGNLSAPPGPARECNYGENPLTPANDPFVCQNKLIGGAHFTDNYDAILGDDPFAGTARDGDGHGTHTSSTSAGNIVDSAMVFGVERGPINGLAPGAYVMEYKVCGPQGCFSSDSAAAVAQAILDGVDVINFSISGGTNPFTDPVELAFLDAYAAGVFVSASAGNSGPAAGTVNHVGPWTTTVAASTQTREFASTLTLNADNGDTFTVDGASITAGAGPLPVVLARDFPGFVDALCSTAAPAGIFEGLIVACQRGVQARVFKGFNVLQGGAEGMVLYNPTLADNETDNHWLPTVHLADGTDFVAFMDGHTGVTGSFTAGTPRDGQGDVMAAFSSRGPGGLVIKPDITAPGVQILAGASPVPAPAADGGGPPGEFFQAIAGTSMSSPHVAGAGLLLRALHPNWTPGQIKSALMTTAIQNVVKEDLSTPAGPLDFGGGRIDIGMAGSAGVTFDETAFDFFALGGDELNAVHLNLPSINIPILAGSLTTRRVAANTGNGAVTYRVTTAAPAKTAIEVSPKQLAVGPGQSADLRITVRTTATSGTHFGQITLTPRGGGVPLHLPVVFVAGQGGVALTSSCNPAQIAHGTTSTCDVSAVNNGFNQATVELTSTLSNNLIIEEVIGADQQGARRAHLGPVDLAPALLGVPSVDPGALFGYIPLDAFGVTPIAIGDEEAINFNVPSFVYNGQTFTSLGVVSNGYVVVGGATAEDIECCNLPTGPDPARPNNHLAPFWTDLDGTSAPGIFIALLTDGVNSWLVVEFRLNVFGTSDLQTFQTWIGVDGVQDITYAYDLANLPSDPGMPFLVGAENPTGEGEMEAVLPTEDLRVTSTDPEPGDSVSYQIVVRGSSVGNGTVTTEMVASTVAGVTVVTARLKVTPS